jgi:hypothetical protein
MVMHSSPVEVWESFDCFGKKVEEQTADENAACHMLNTSYTFQKVPDMLKWADDKINFMFCVKESSDIPRAISTVIENNATHRAFLEIGVSEMLDLVEQDTEGWQEVYYIIEMGGVDSFNRCSTWRGCLLFSRYYAWWLFCAAVMTVSLTNYVLTFHSMMNAPAEVLQRTFLFEFGDWASWDPATLNACLAAAKAAGVRTVGVSRDSGVGATVRNHLQIYQAGFDVVYTYNVENAVTARRITNIQRGVVPP